MPAERDRTMSDTTPAAGAIAPLAPVQPPGRRSRKARAYADQIRALQAVGYTLDAIRDALAAAGVAVSRSTVHREAMRSRRSGASSPGVPTARTTPVVSADPALHAPIPVVPGCARPSGPPLKSRDIATAFLDGRVTNSLLRARLRDEENR